MYHFIINLKARSGYRKHVWTTVENALLEKNIPYEAHITESKSEATLLAHTLCQTDEPRVIVAVGGDGTLNEVACSFIPKENLTLGFIPAGSSNDFARSIGISSDPLEALEIILSAKRIISHDVGHIKCGGIECEFMVSCGIGFDASISLEALTSSLKKCLNKFGLGKLIYLLIALKQLAFYKTQKGTITLDNEKKIEHSKILFISVHNHKYEGGGFMFCPEANAEDQLLDVCIIEGISKLKILTLFPSALKGEHISHPGVHIFQCKQVDILMENPQEVHVDGETCKKHKDLHVTFLPKPFKFIAK